VYLVKPMPGLEVAFDLVETTPPLVQVLGAAAATAPQTPVDMAYGPLRLAGYDWEPAAGDPITVTLHWQVAAPLAADYSATVQLFDDAGEKLAQSDHRPGGAFYPTSLWKPGEVLLDRHTLTLPAGAQPARMLLGFYDADQSLLDPPMELPLAP
ncbi:MAG: hypothetical protein KAX65_16100, partial [Caldilineaceae bacterium]|nr:hypothetical protein [Caldilineaceae bacterium]